MRRQKSCGESCQTQGELGGGQEAFDDPLAVEWFEGYEDREERFIGTLRDWERGRVEPDQAARAYLMVIVRNPKAVREALEPAA